MKPINRLQTFAHLASCATPANDAAGFAADAFAASLSETLVPLEDPPHLAVAVSGGADSMALCRLAADWTQKRGGRVTALTVDHRLRPESGEECRRVGDWMRCAGIEHHILPWFGAKPVTAIQKAARQERYRLLLGWCREAGVVHLLLGHHHRDQAETVLHRMLRGSGLRGLAGMAPVVEMADIRLLRPLLDWSPDLLRVLLRCWGWEWLDDPSNDDPRFARTRLRQAASTLAAFGVTSEALLKLSADARAARAAMQSAVAELVAAACHVHPAGFVRIGRRDLLAAPREVAAAAMARMLAAVGGGEYPPSAVRVRALLADLTDADGRSTTLGRCRIISRKGGLWLFRERRDLPAESPLLPCDGRLWDGRFRVVCQEVGFMDDRHLQIRPFAAADTQILRGAGLPGAANSMPHLARSTLPILCDESGLAMAPLLNYCRPDIVKLRGMIVQMAWNPRVGITEAGCFPKWDNSLNI